MSAQQYDDKKKNKNLNNLLDQSRTVFYLCCSKCWQEGEWTEGEPEQAYDEGWRATDKNTYCSLCAKKFSIK